MSMAHGKFPFQPAFVVSLFQLFGYFSCVVVRSFRVIIVSLYCTV